MHLSNEALDLLQHLLENIDKPTALPLQSMPVAIALHNDVRRERQQRAASAKAAKVAEFLGAVAVPASPEAPGGTVVSLDRRS